MALLAALTTITGAQAQDSSRPRNLPVFVTLQLEDIQRLNVSPLVWTLWGYLAGESRVTESEGFGLSIAPHFGRANITSLKRLLVWSAAGAAVGVLATSAPNHQAFRLPRQPALTAALGAAGGAVTGEFVWLVLTPHEEQKPRPVITIELTALPVRLERASTPIALPEISYAWVPAFTGKW